jgi:hypothetical protein
MSYVPIDPESLPPGLVWVDCYRIADRLGAPLATVAFANDPSEPPETPVRSGARFKCKKYAAPRPDGALTEWFARISPSRADLPTPP